MDYQTRDIDGRPIAFHLAGNTDRLVVLLHGWPETADCWRAIVPVLSDRFTVLAPDLPGYGRSAPAPGGGDKRSVARVLSELVAGLGFDTAMVAGHDRGARVAHRWALDRPDQVSRLAVLDVVPMLTMLERLDPASARNHWHWFFHLAPVAECVIERGVREHLWPFLVALVDSGAIDAAAAEQYVAAYEKPGRVAAFLDDYRASFTTDLAADKHDVASGVRLAMPVLALWGTRGGLGSSDVVDVWREYAVSVRGRGLDCGHYLPEERPSEVADELRAFFLEAQ